MITCHMPITDMVYNSYYENKNYTSYLTPTDVSIALTTLASGNLNKILDK